MAELSIGQVAQRAGVGIETIRFYEREGLIADPPRKPSGYREYSPEVVRRITFIRRAKDLGFSLKEIGELLGLKVHPRSGCAAVKRNAEAKISVRQTIDRQSVIEILRIDRIDCKAISLSQICSSSQR